MSPHIHVNTEGGADWQVAPRTLSARSLLFQEKGV